MSENRTSTNSEFFGLQESGSQSNQPEQNNEADSEMDHQNSNSSNTAARFARPMESGDNVDRTNGNTFTFSYSENTMVL